MFTQSSIPIACCLALALGGCGATSNQTDHSPPWQPPSAQAAKLLSQAKLDEGVRVRIRRGDRASYVIIEAK
jgi:hypothetical protein